MNSLGTGPASNIGHNLQISSNAIGSTILGSQGGGSMFAPSSHRRSLQDVDALGLFHHGKGTIFILSFYIMHSLNTSKSMRTQILHPTQILGHGRHLVQQSSESDLRRRSTASLATSVTHLPAVQGKNQLILLYVFGFYLLPKHQSESAKYCIKVYFLHYKYLVSINRVTE